MPGNPGSHANQKLRQIDNFRLTGGIFENRLAARQRCGHHQVFGAGHGHRVKNDMRTLQAFCPGAYVTVFHDHPGAHRLQALHMQVDRARPDGTAAGQRNIGFPETRDQRTQHEN